MLKAHTIQWEAAHMPKIKLHEVINAWIVHNQDRRILWSNQSESIEGMSNLHITVTLYHVPNEA
jgi:hypothetical protein